MTGSWPGQGSGPGLHGSQEAVANLWSLQEVFTHKTQMSRFKLPRVVTRSKTARKAHAPWKTLAVTHCREGGLGPAPPNRDTNQGTHVTKSFPTTMAEKR